MCATRYHARRLSDSQEHPSSSTTEILAPSSAATSTFTMSSERSTTVRRSPIYYESRMAKLDLADSEKPRIDEDFEEVTEGEEVARKERLKSKWAQLESVVGSGKRLEMIAADLVEHFEKRLAAMDGKAMIVCMSRRICVDLYSEIVKLRPEWHSDDDESGTMKVVMTGSASDPLRGRRTSALSGRARP